MYGTKNICADFREGRISINGVSYTAWTFAVHLLNQFYKDDTAARLSAFKNYGRMVLDQLRLGYLKENDFLETGREIHEILNTLPKLSPFDTWDIDKEREQISGLFTETIDLYCQYTDEDEEETLEICFADERTQTENLFFAIERAEQVMDAFESLNSRERAMVSDHLGFCRDCYGINCVDSHGVQEKRKAIPFADLATRHGLSSPDTAFRIYHGVLEKMRKKLMKEGITHI